MKQTQNELVILDYTNSTGMVSKENKMKIEDLFEYFHNMNPFVWFYNLFDSYFNK